MGDYYLGQWGRICGNTAMNGPALGRPRAETVQAASGISQQPDWHDALAEALEQMPKVQKGESSDLCCLFASSAYADDFGKLLAEASAATQAGCIVGCSGQGVIGVGREIENEPALTLLALRLPGVVLRPVRFTQADVQRGDRPEYWHTSTGVSPEDANAWLVFADPFTLDAERLVAEFSQAYPGTPVVGGMASGGFGRRQTHVFLNERVYDHGAVAVALGGAYAVRTVVSQGCTPVGEPWTITGVQGQFIQTIAHRTAYDVLVETVRGLPPEMQRRASGNLFVGLAMDEHRVEGRRGEFLIRNLLGVDQASGALAVSAVPRLGQTMQFQIRDAVAADEDLHEMLTAVAATLKGQKPVAALLCSCNGRGVGLFGRPDHDARALAQRLGRVPVAGFFCNGEIGPVGVRTYLHGFTASIALVVPQQPRKRGDG